VIADDAQAPEKTHRRRVPGWIAAVAVVAAVLLTGVVTHLVTGGDARPAPGAAKPSTAAPTAASAPGTPVGGYQVKAGAGGTATAVDGRTPIGYPGNCQGAVEAATNYYTALAEGLFQDRLTPDGFAALLAQLNAGLDVDGANMGALKTQFATIRDEGKAKNIPFYNLQSHPEWGVFRVQSCAKGTTAVIDIAGFSTDDATPGLSNKSQQQISVSWFKDDWRIFDVKDQATDLYDSSETWPAAPVPTDVRKAMIAQGGPAWTEYTNAPQK